MSFLNSIISFEFFKTFKFQFAASISIPNAAPLQLAHQSTSEFQHPLRGAWRDSPRHDSLEPHHWTRRVHPICFHPDLNTSKIFRFCDGLLFVCSRSLIFGATDLNYPLIKFKVSEGLHIGLFDSNSSKTLNAVYGKLESESKMHLEDYKRNFDRKREDNNLKTSEFEESHCSRVILQVDVRKITLTTRNPPSPFNVEKVPKTTKPFIVKVAL